MDSLRNLPAGAVYEKKSGQAGLKLSYENGKIHATATCDSLQNLIYQYEEELTRIRDQLEQQQRQSEPAESPFKWYLYGVLTGILLSIIIKYKRK